MKKYIFFFFNFLLVMFLNAPAQNNQVNTNKKYVLVIHGGAGAITKAMMTPEKEAAYKKALQQALQAGFGILQSGKSSLDAVQAAIKILEDNPLFNAGKGAVFTHDGRNELDASIMDGSNLKAGAVAGVTTIKNPIDAARAVMEQSPHVMLAGKGAEAFAKERGLTIVNPKYFYTQDRWEGLQRAIKAEATKNEKSKINPPYSNDNKFGTVGAVALDNAGNLAAGTSTGGMTNKRYNRIGDSPVIGAGTYANNNTVAVSGTGWGEIFMRSIAAYDVSAMMEYKDVPVSHAAQAVVDKIAKLGGEGGLIALDKNGNMAMPFNTQGMYRAAITNNGEMEIYIYK